MAALTPAGKGDLDSHEPATSDRNRAKGDFSARPADALEGIALLGDRHPQDERRRNGSLARDAAVELLDKTEGHGGLLDRILGQRDAGRVAHPLLPHGADARGRFDSPLLPISPL